MSLASKALAESALGDQGRGRSAAATKAPPKRRVYAKPDRDAHPEPR